METKFSSRKFLVTLLVILCTTILATAGKVDTNVALIFGACITSYNFVNGWVEKKNA